MKTYKENFVLRNFHLDEELISDLKNQAECEERSQSSIVRRALRKYFESNGVQKK